MNVQDYETRKGFFLAHSISYGNQSCVFLIRRHSYFLEDYRENITKDHVIVQIMRQGKVVLFSE